MTLHIHVGHNVPGYLPESDVMCFDSVEGALDALRHDIKDAQDDYFENCHTEDWRTDAGDETPCECAWCDVATDAEAALSAIADGDAAYTFGRNCHLGWHFSPPEGADVIHWMTELRADRDDCEIFADQES